MGQAPLDTSELDAGDRAALIRLFLAESAEGLDSMDEALVALESRPGDGELVATVFRVVHTLKGNAASLGYEALVRYSHALEDLLDRLRAGTVPITSGLVTILLRSTDALRDLLSRVDSGHEEATAAQQELLDWLARESSRAGGAANLHGPAAGPGGVAAFREHWGLRVAVDRLDRMLDLTGEGAIARARLGRMVALLTPPTEVLEALQEVDRLAIDLQELVMKARLVPLRATLRPFVRTVRDLAAAVGKQARVTIAGEEVEVDTSVVEHVRDPLMHMVRNAVDHGLEPPEVREAQGKDPCGTIALSARHEAGRIVVEVEDDGAGLDRERIVARARARGMETAGLSEDEVERLIFEPGFSTAETVTELSGRGIGLDIVRRHVAAIRGTVTVSSVKGRGTSMRLTLPLSVAIIDGFAVGVGRETYVLPLDLVVQCLELPRNALGVDDATGVIDLHGSVLPCLRLRRMHGVRSAAAGREHVVVVCDADGRTAGLVVDELHGPMQTVIKSLGQIFESAPGVAGSAILSSGRVALILDVPGLMAETRRRAENPGPGHVTAACAGAA